MAGASHTREVDPQTVTQRLQREGRWSGQIELERDKMMKLAKKRFPDKEERQQWVYSELDRMYPPPEKPPMAVSQGAENTQSNTSKAANGGIETIQSGSGRDQIQGLGDIPDDWPDLPANASLGTEIGWVQANRLRIVEEYAGTSQRKTRVHLGGALSPAPSWAALGWLETSIRNYAKFVDVAAKVSGSGDDESAVMRRERVAIEEMERLLGEMMEEEAVCPRCGRPT
jgi:hypothetical protein